MSDMSSSRSLCAAVAVFALMSLTTSPATGQIPEEFTNLQLLPEDIERRQLIDTMRGFSMQLGVRCSHCHVGEDQTSAFSDYDFPSDDKETKRIARTMITMTREINEKHLTSLGRDDVFQVTCATCHDGLPKPATLNGQLMSSFDDGGTYGLLETYKSLRDEHYGRGVYNFGEDSLIGVATTLARGREDLGAAQAVLELNLEYYPDSFMTWYSMGELKSLAADNEGAAAAFQKALEIEPDNKWAKAALERLQQ